MENQRVLRVILPVETISKLDSVLERQLSGYGTRNDIIRDAVDAYLAELLFGPPIPERESNTAGAGRDAANAGERVVEHGSPATNELPATVDIRDSGQPMKLAALGETKIISNGVAIVKDEPLFGLHNRDFPSLWAAREIADITSHDLAPADECLRKVVENAWKFGRRLAAVDSDSPMKLTALFPTNPEKRDASESAFRQFAIGTWWSLGDSLHASGPVFNWHVCQLETRGKVLTIGLTPEGANLLEDLAGLSVGIPHEEQAARVFLGHIRTVAPADFRGFLTVLKAANDQASRSQLQEAFNAWKMGWTKLQLASYSAAYVSRAREWGLLETKQELGRYILTDFGRRIFLETST